jgi:hypothetical protein
MSETNRNVFLTHGDPQRLIRTISMWDMDLQVRVPPSDHPGTGLIGRHLGGTELLEHLADLPENFSLRGG